MDRKKGIIISTTGIIVILLALIGFTYGFYLSVIYGNASSKSITVQSGHSKIEYIELTEDDDTQIIGVGYTNTKYFAVKNIGDVSSSYYIYLVDVINEYTRQEDIVYTLYRTDGDTTQDPEDFDITATYDFSTWENVTSSNCSIASQYSSYGDCQYPSSKSLLKTTKETIMNPNDYYVYAFVVTYINQPDVDQSTDEGHVFSGKVKIYAEETGADVSPFEDGTLADAIVESALAGTNGTIYRETPLTTPGKEASLTSESTLSVTEDNYGVSYYYRGNVQDNYLNFAGMCWRIVRIQGDGSIKIILADRDNECNSSTYSSANTSSAYINDNNYLYYFDTSGNYIDNYYYNSSSNKSYIDVLNAWISGGTILNETFSQKISDSLQNYMKSEKDLYYSEITSDQCNPMSSYDEDGNETIDECYYYDYVLNENVASLKFKTLSSRTYKIDLITIDEIKFAGAYENISNSYMLTNASSGAWYTKSEYGYYNVTPTTYNYIIADSSLKYTTVLTSNTYIDADYLSIGSLLYYSHDNDIKLRPVIVLNEGIEATGDGTQSNPYVVE